MTKPLSAVQAERNRCRKEEVEPLFRAVGEMFAAAHHLSAHVCEQTLHNMWRAADKAIRVRARVGKVQAKFPVTDRKESCNDRD